MNIFKLIHALESAFLWTLETSLYATVLVALVFAVQFCFRKLLAPRWRYALSLLVVLRLALPVVPQSSLSLFNLFHRTSPSDNVTVRYESPTAAPELSGPPVLEGTMPVVLPPEPEVALPVTQPFRLGRLLKFIWLAGFVTMLAIVARQHRRFVLESRRWGAVTDPRVLGLLDECRNVIGIRRPLRMLAATGLNTPALFGFWKPRLLMPEELLARLTDQELRHVFLHELLHLRRGDVLVNWTMILLRAVHWFNPAVWLAFRRLRADQELACDAAVMSRLDVPERRHYGATLIKLLEDFSARGLCPGVVPFVTNKQVIKRRISMIAAFKPTGRLAMLGSFAIVGLLGISTFTRASQGTMGASPVEGEPVAAPSYGATLNPFGASAEALNRVVKDMDDRVRNQELMVAKLRAAFQVVDSDPQSSGPGSSLGPMNILQLNSIKIQAESDAMKQEAQLETLEALAKADPEQLKHTLPRLTSDPILTQLLQESLTVESQLAFQLGTMGKEHPDVKKNIELKKKLDEQIGKQVAANLEAMKTGVRTSKAQAENAQRRLDEARANDIKIAVETRPYWEAKAELDRMKRMQEVIQLRKVQEQIEAGLGTLGHQSSPTLLKDDSLAESIRALIDKLNQMNATQKAGAGQESRQPSSGVSPEVRRKYAEARELLSQARDGYKQELLSVPDGSPLLDRHKRRIAQFEAEVAKYDAQYPGIAVAGNPEVLSWSSALVLIVERDGTMKFGSSKEAISLDQLKTALMREHEKDPTIVLNIKADTSVPAQRIYDILDAAKKAGISSISLQTLSNLK